MGGGVMKVLSQPLQMTTVERATYANLMKMKDEIEKNEKLGHSFTLLDRAYWLAGPAKRTINDRLKRSHLVNNNSRFKKASRSPNTWRVGIWVEIMCVSSRWYHHSYVRTSAHTGSMTDFLRELPQLTYTYWEQDNHGESVLHEDLMKLFSRTTVWQSLTEDESEAIWMQYPSDEVT